MRGKRIDRRERTWGLLIVRNKPETKVVEQVAREFDCAESTVKRDIKTMEEWLGDLDPAVASRPVSILRELRETRSRRRELIELAREDGDLEFATKLQEDIEENLTRTLELCETYGVFEKREVTFEVADHLLDQEFDTLE